MTRELRQLQNICNTSGIVSTLILLSDIVRSHPSWRVRKLAFHLDRFTSRVPTLDKAPFGISVGAAEKVYWALYDNPKRMSVYEIAQSTGVGHATVRLIALFLRNNGIVREHKGKSTEVYRYSLTPGSASPGPLKEE